MEKAMISLSGVPARTGGVPAPVEDNAVLSASADAPVMPEGGTSRMKADAAATSYLPPAVFADALPPEVTDGDTAADA